MSCMFFIVASLIALCYVSCRRKKFIVVRYFSGAGFRLARRSVGSQAAPSAALDAPDDASGAAPLAPPAAVLQPKRAELSAYLDKDASWLGTSGHPLRCGLHGRPSHRRNLDAHYRWADREQGGSYLGTVFSALRNRRGVLTVICYQLHKHHANNLVISWFQLLLAALEATYRLGIQRFPLRSDVCPSSRRHHTVGGLAILGFLGHLEA